MKEVTEQQDPKLQDLLVSKSMNQLVALIRAKVPLIYVTTHEESRFLDDFDILMKKAFDYKRSLWCWSTNSGLVKGWKKYHIEKAEDGTLNPKAALEKIIAHEPPGQNAPGDIYVMRDLHKQLTGDIPRLLRDMYDHMVSKKKVVIILAPYLGYGPMGEKRGIEPTLEKQMAVVNFELPTREMLLKVIKRSVVGLKESANAHKFKLDFTEEHYNQFARACQGLTKQEAENAIATCVVQLRTVDLNQLLQEKKNIIKKSDILEYIETPGSVKDVGGMDEAKSFFDSFKGCFEDDAKAYGVEPLRGVLLTGVPGTGKSLLAKAVAQEFALPLLRLDVGRVMTGLVGGSEQRMREGLNLAEAVAPCVLWIDEIEKALSGTGSSNNSDGGTIARVFGTLLTAMEEEMEGIIVVATANDISKLPPELIRRFTEVFFVDLPVDEERAEVFAIHLKKKGRDPKKFNMPELIKASEDYTGAEIEKAVGTGLNLAWQDAKREVQTSDIVKALTKTKPISKVMAKNIAELRAWAKDRARYASSAAEAKNAPGGQVIKTTTGKSISVDDVLGDLSEVVTKKPTNDTPKDLYDLDVGD